MRPPGFRLLQSWDRISRRNRLCDGCISDMNASNWSFCRNHSRPKNWAEKARQYDRQGKVLGTAGEPGDYQELALSPDGTRAAPGKRSGQASDLWLLDLSRDTSTRFTFGSATDWFPVWSPDGSRIIFRSGNDLYQKSTSSVKDAELVLKSSDAPEATDWSRDGRFLLYRRV